MSLPIKTDANLHLQQERSPDPIMLLAAAAAVIADEGNRYKKRSYERREIRLHGRHGNLCVCTDISMTATVNTDHFFFYL